MTTIKDGGHIVGLFGQVAYQVLQFNIRNA
jgi:hypothetical protein